MKYFFVANPTAGNGGAERKAKELAKACFNQGEYELYETKGKGDATRYVKEKINEFKGEKLRFYACGGDGTLNEVINGAAEQSNVSVSVLPLGSGNDFVKYYGDAEKFLNSEAIKMGVEHPIDVLKVCGRYCINVCNFGFDAKVAETMINVKPYPLVGGSRAYTSGIVYALLCGMKNRCTVSVDGNILNPDGKLLLCTVANGRYVGGKFQCAPVSQNDDGLLDVCLIKPVSRFRFLKIMGPYTNGMHLESPEFKDIVEYRRGVKAEIVAQEGFGISVDGEIEHADKFSVEVIPGGINFVIPPCFIKEKKKEQTVK